MNDQRLGVVVHRAQPATATTGSTITMRPALMAAHGGRGLIAGLVTVAGGASAPPDHSIAVALIGAGASVGAIFIGQATAEWIRSRHQPIDHAQEHTNEQAELALHAFEHMLDEIAERDRIIAEKDMEIGRLRRRLRAR